MATDYDSKNFVAEFEALKAKYAPSFADLRLVRFTDQDGQAGFRDFVPYACRQNDSGDIICEEERPV